MLDDPDDIVPDREKYAKNRRTHRETGYSARRDGRRQHDDDRRRSRHAPRSRQAYRLADTDGYGSARQADRRPLAAHQGLRAAGVLDDVVFGGWDIFEDNCVRGREDGRRAGAGAARKVRPELEQIRPMAGGVRPTYVKRLDGPNVKKGANKRELADQVRDDMQRFKAGARTRSARHDLVRQHRSLPDGKPGARERRGIRKRPRGQRSRDSVEHDLRLRRDQRRDSVRERGAEPERRCSGAARARRTDGSPVAGKDLKTGQTLMKTVIAPGLKARLLGVEGWYSTNILGNRDGEVLDDPESFKTKEESKKSVLDYILQPNLYPDLYEKLCHVVRINYYPPRGDNKEGWDNIDLFGWLGYPMQLKINFLCRDSILAAPIVLDVALFLDLAKRPGMSGIQEWLSFYFKSPMARARVCILSTTCSSS